ncbi:unnamed protein product [Camellia sinensis]
MGSDIEASNCITPRSSCVQSLMNCRKACAHTVKIECMKMKQWFGNCCNIMAMFLRNKWNNVKGWAKALLSIIMLFSKNTWTKMKEIFTIDRVVAILALGMEVASAIMEQISSAKEQQPKATNDRRLYVMALLATVFSLLGLVLALLEMIHKARSSRRWINCKFLWVNIAFALVQTITSLVQFIFLQFYEKNDPIKFLFLPIVFALIVVVLRFIPNHTDTIEAHLSHGNQTHNVIEEKVDGENHDQLYINA